MNKRYEEGRKPFFSNPGEKLRRQYVWTKNEEGQEELKETEPIDIQQEKAYKDYTGKPQTAKVRDGIKAKAKALERAAQAVKAVQTTNRLWTI
jgi:hypothetical protein